MLSFLREASDERPALPSHRSLLQDFVEALRARHRRRRAVADLQALSDRSLADIGIDRSEIGSLVLGLRRDSSRRSR
jgi:uncharacterized protein YjiS (DUF1127 family)